MILVELYGEESALIPLPRIVLLCVLHVLPYVSAAVYPVVYTVWNRGIQVRVAHKLRQGKRRRAGGASTYQHRTTCPVAASRGLAVHAPQHGAQASYFSVQESASRRRGAQISSQRSISRSHARPCVSYENAAVGAPSRCLVSSALEWAKAD